MSVKDITGDSNLLIMMEMGLVDINKDNLKEGLASRSENAFETIKRIVNKKHGSDGKRLLLEALMDAGESRSKEIAAYTKEVIGELPEDAIANAARYIIKDVLASERRSDMLQEAISLAELVESRNVVPLTSLDYANLGKASSVLATQTGDPSWTIHALDWLEKAGIVDRKELSAIERMQSEISGLFNQEGGVKEKIERLVEKQTLLGRADSRYSDNLRGPDFAAVYERIKTIIAGASSAISTESGIGERAIRTDIEAYLQKAPSMPCNNSGEAKSLKGAVLDMEGRLVLLKKLTVDDTKRYEDVIKDATSKISAYEERVKGLHLHRTMLEVALGKMSSYKGERASKEYAELHRRSVDVLSKHRPVAKEYKADKELRPVLKSCSGLASKLKSELKSDSFLAKNAFTVALANINRDVKALSIQTADDLERTEAWSRKLDELVEAGTYFNVGLEGMAEYAKELIEEARKKYQALKSENMKAIAFYTYEVEFTMQSVKDMFSKDPSPSHMGMKNTSIKNLAEKLKEIEGYAADRSLKEPVDKARSSIQTLKREFESRVSGQIAGYVSRTKQLLGEIEAGPKDTVQALKVLEGKRNELTDLIDKLVIFTNAGLADQKALIHLMYMGYNTVESSIREYNKTVNEKQKQLDQHLEALVPALRVLNAMIRTPCGFDTWKVKRKRLDKMVSRIYGLNDLYQKAGEIRNFEDDDNFRKQRIFSLYRDCGISLQAAVAHVFNAAERDRKSFREWYWDLDKAKVQNSPEEAHGIRERLEYICHMEHKASELERLGLDMRGWNTSWQAGRLDSLLPDIFWRVGKQISHHYGSGDLMEVKVHKSYATLRDNLYQYIGSASKKDVKRFKTRLSELSKIFAEYEAAVKWVHYPLLEEDKERFEEVKKEELRFQANNYDRMRNMLDEELASLRTSNRELESAAKWYSIVTPRLMLNSRRIRKNEKLSRRLTEIRLENYDIFTQMKVY